MPRWMAVGLAVGLGAGCELLEYELAPSRYDALSPAEVSELERKSAERPDALEPRVRLLHHYFLDQSPEGRKARARHALWVIQHAPDSDVAGQPYTGFHSLTEPESYKAARDLWLEKVKNPDAASPVLKNAASFFTAESRELAEELLLRGAAREPEQAEWREELGRLYRLDGQRGDGTIEPGAARKALAQYEEALRRMDEGRQYYLLGEVSEAAYHAGEKARARETADELLRRAVRQPRDWNFGNAIHDAHRILGHLDLDAGNVEAAKRHLLDAGATPGSPQLGSFGPELTLAQALLDRGERDVVVEYLKLISKFWKMRGTAVDEWIGEISSGGRPRLDRHEAGRD